MHIQLLYIRYSPLLPLLLVFLNDAHEDAMIAILLNAQYEFTKSKKDAWKKHHKIAHQDKIFNCLPWPLLLYKCMTIIKKINWKYFLLLKSVFTMHKAY